MVNNLMTRRRQMLDCLFSGLPSEYQQVEYIAGTGTQYIDTGTTVSKGSIITVIFEISTAENNIVMYGWRRSGAYTGVYQLYINANEGHELIIAGVSSLGVGNNYLYSISTQNTIVFDTASEVITVNGENADCNYSLANGKAFDSSGSSAYNPYLFALNNRGSAVALASNTKIYGYTVTQDGTELQNFIPCYRKSDGVIGMYDTVSRTFFTNSGTGTFIKGADV